MLRRALLLGFFILVFVGAGVFVKTAYIGSPRAGARIRVEVPQDATVDVVAERLAAQGVIDSARWYRAYSVIDSRTKRARAGAYDVVPGASLQSLAVQFSRGPERVETAVRVIEGWTLTEIEATLVKDYLIGAETFRRLAGERHNAAAFDPALRLEFSFLQSVPPGRSLEGFLFPDTYRVYEDTLPEGLIRKQLAEFQARFGDARVESRSAPLSSLFEVVTLASIVEKEVPGVEDRRRVAGVFLRRLREGMPLQSDATLSYLTGSKRAQASAKDLQLDSPYNSYKVKGLPPGPIGNPGATAIEAVLDPVLGEDRYFLTDKAGKVFYAATFEGHIRNRQKAGY